MKFKIRSRANMAIISVDGRPSEVDTEFKHGAEKTVEINKTLCIAGNPIDPWRIVVDLEVLEE